MENLFRFSSFLACSWCYTHHKEPMPTKSNILDYALYDVQDILPETFKSILSFGNTRVGFRCYEMSDILYCMKANLLTYDDDFNAHTYFNIDEDTARRLLKRQMIPLEDAKHFATLLKEKCSLHQKEERQHEMKSPLWN
jgi:hypothetical protein